MDASSFEPSPPIIAAGNLSLFLTLLLCGCAAYVTPPPKPEIWNKRFEYVVPSEWDQEKAGCKEVGFDSFNRWFGADGVSDFLRFSKSRYEYAELWLRPVTDSVAQDEGYMAFAGIALVIRVPSGLTVQYESRDFLTTNLADGIQYAYSAGRGSALIKPTKRQGIVDDSYDKINVDFLERLVGHTYRLPSVLRWSDSEPSFNSFFFEVMFSDFRTDDVEIRVPAFFVNEHRYSLPPIRWTAVFGAKENIFHTSMNCDVI